MLVLTVILGALLVVAIIQIVRYEKELRHMAQFLSSRKMASSTTLKSQVQTRGARRLTKAINDELADHHEERTEIAKRQKEFKAGLAHLSHDIRTPLAGARGYIQLMEDEQDVNERARYHKSVARRLDDLNQMLDQLFMFTQVADPEYIVDPMVLDANELLSEVLLSLYPQFKEKGIEPVVELEENSEVVADREALKRIMLNLVTNALRHGSGEVSILQQGVTYSFSNLVADPSMIEVDQLFERFYKADPNRSGEGSGLGLAIVYQLAEAIGASVEAVLQDNVLSITLILRKA